MNGQLGTLNWMERTGGKLAWRDRLALVLHGVQSKVRTRKRIKAGIKIRYSEIDDILPPDSPICREATALCQDASEPFLFNHCLRAYFWARLLDSGSKSFDDEAVFTAIMLHDLGLSDSYRLKGDKEQCFTLVGANKASEMAIKHGWSDKRALLTASAITLHLNVAVGDEHGREAQMVRTGSGGDVAGLDLHMLHDDQIAEVVNRYPRLGLKKKITSVLKIEVEERPCCRIAFLHKKLGFYKLIRDSLFLE